MSFLRVSDDSAQSALSVSETVDVWERLAAVAEAAHHPGGFRPLGETADRLCREAGEMMGCAMTVLRMPRPTGDELGSVGWWVLTGLPLPSGQPPSAFLGNERIALTDPDGNPVRGDARSPSAEAFLTGQIQTAPLRPAIVPTFPLEFMAVVPVVRQGQVRAVLSCYWEQVQGLSPGPHAMLQMIARLAGMALESAVLASEMEARAGRAAQEEASLRVHATLFETVAAAQARLTGLLGRGRPADLDSLLDAVAEGIGTPVALTARDGRVLAVGAAPGMQDDEADAAEWRVISRVLGENIVHGDLRCPGSDMEPDPISDRLGSFAADVVAAWLDRGLRGQDAGLVARAGLLAGLCLTEPSIGQAEQAAAALGITGRPLLVLVQADFTSQDEAHQCALTLNREFADARHTLVSAAAERTRILALCIADSGPPREVLDRLDAQLGRLGTGLSETFDSLTSLSEQAQQAAAAARLSRARGGRVSLAESGSTAQLLSSVPSEVVRETISQAIGPLLEYDATHGTALTDTLAAYLALSGSTSQVATRLHVHPNTVKQRLDRVQEILGRDVRDYREVSRLVLALEWRALLDGS